MVEKGIREFAEEIKERIVDYLPGDYADSEVKLSEIQKVNRDVTNITVVPDWAEEGVVPTIHLDRMYKEYQEGRSMEDILEKTAETIVDAYNSLKAEPMEYEDPINHMPEDKIYFQLINTESNRDYLNTVPHRELHDMSVIYRILHSKDEDGIKSIVVTNDIQKMWDVSEDRLFEMASENTKELFPPKVTSMADVIRSFMGADFDAMSADDISEMMGESVLWVVSNEMGVNGASLMVYGDVLDEVAERIGDDIYVIPSSLHEVLAVPASELDPKEIADMVSDINRNVVNEEDRLSNQVFFYDRGARELSVAVESPVKGIKDMEYSTMVAEQKTEFNRSNVEMNHSKPAVVR